MVYSETVLLVDYYESEIFEPDIVFDYCVCSYKDIYFPFLKLLVYNFSFTFFCAAGKQGYIYCRTLHQADEVFVVLYCQYFGGGHNARLCSIVDCQQGGQKCDKSFSAADISLWR